ncbi:chemotaxis phosphatase CheZ [Thiogranum longum]|uniref:Protein phosphatase CheZ n=1 Tax=Thiogranum longum TaxID=1537524 RepID=A0A4R1HES1_9GAMM|nr:protein phosphatase CheZ [Thiogranum longum]TCK18825.1 chemotaxis phosphatase CheZ [Thiogranum longum]
MEAVIEVETESLLDNARALVAELESGNEAGAEKLIEQLGRMREQSLFQELGKMTRQLHESINSFVLDDRMQSLARSDIPDAKARLNHVIEMTESSANRTLGAVESTLPVSEALKSRANALHEKWDRFRNKEMDVDEFRAMSREIDEFLTITTESTETIHSGLSDIMMAQDFQDLTGQILSRVITLVQEVEDNLVDLVRLSGGIEHVEKTEGKPAVNTGEADDMMQGVGPAVPGVEADGESVSGQDEVDDLLSSLGF